MALKATIFKVELAIADLTRDYYHTHALTIARHPSETDTRMMARLLAFAHNASDRLEFTRGISTDNEPDIWQKNLSDEIELWIELGQPEEKRLRKACSRSQAVKVYGFAPRVFDVWMAQNQSAFNKLPKLQVYQFGASEVDELAQACQRTMLVNVTLEDDSLLVNINDTTTSVPVRGQLR